MLFLRTITFFLLFTACSSPPRSDSSNSENIVLESIQETPIEYADQQLRSKGVSENFIQTIHKKYLDKNKNWKEPASKIIELNVYGFLAHSNYDLHFSPQAIKKTQHFLKTHKSSLDSAFKAYSVNPKAIAALIWVETKFGKNLGSFDLPFVYYALILGSHPDFIRQTLKSLPEKASPERLKEMTIQSAQLKVVERSKSKANWAMEEIKAVEQIQSDFYFNPFRIKSSFAGAFGIPQFIPTTYLKHAISDYRKKPNLFKDSDAISSVAHFLKDNGWNETDPESKVKALYAYNRSKDYGAVILKLSEAL